MSLRKSPTMTPARLEANRRNSKKSTGPRTARGKAQSRLNALRDGSRSALRENVLMALLDAPPCRVGEVARALMNSGQATHPLIAEMVTIARWAEGEVPLQEIFQLGPSLAKRKNPPEKLRGKSECC